MQDHEFKHNFHTHTFRCKHASGDVDEYCEKALEMGMETLGFSDHSALPDDRWLKVRMPYIDLPDYVGAVNNARGKFPTLDILLGMECEYLPELRNWYADELRGRYGFEYLIGAAHFFMDGEQWHGTYGGTKNARMLRKFADYNVDLIDSGLFEFLAHPDLFGNCYPGWDVDAQACSRDIAAAAADKGVALEINALGLRKQASRPSEFPMYPWIHFWEAVSDYDVKVIVNSDAHRPDDLQGMTGAAVAIAETLNLTMINPDVIGNRDSGTIA